MAEKGDIWVLGRLNTSADKSFSWEDHIPNIADADVVILDLSTLDYAVNSQRDKAKTRIRVSEIITYDAAQQQLLVQLDKAVIVNLKNKIVGGGHVIYLLHHNNASSHVGFMTKPLQFLISINFVADRSKILYAPDHCFKEYLAKIKTVNYDLTMPSSYLVADPNSAEELLINENSLVTDNSGTVIGATFTVNPNNKIHGQLTFLPAPLGDDGTEMINTLITKLRGSASEPPPSWFCDLDIVGLDDLKMKITDLELQRDKIDNQITELNDRKKNLSKYGELLYATGKQLEEAVKVAFSLLGFTEIAQTRGKDKEDWRIEFKSMPDVQIGVLEVKGRNQKTKRADIVKCNTWVDDYIREDPDVNPKGIFISNQFRRNKFPDSKEQRKHFEPNEIEYAKSRKICIIPSYVLFEAVNKILDGQPSDRTKIEQLILDADGVLESIL